MKLYRQILKESLLMILISVLFGIAYAYVTKQTIFKDNPVMSKPKLDIIYGEQAYDLFISNKAVFVDARLFFEYNLGHIPKSICVPLKDFEKFKVRLNNVQKDKTIVVYCESEDCNNAMDAAIKILELDYTDVRVFIGGWKEWSANNYPVEK